VSSIGCKIPEKLRWVSLRFDGFKVVVSFLETEMAEIYHPTRFVGAQQDIPGIDSRSLSDK
jgi:hypothetical protein